MNTRPIVPSEAQLQALIARGPTGPIVMVNLIKYRAKAAYESNRPEAKLNLSGRDAYLRYGMVAQKCVGEAGGSIVWSGSQRLVVIGDDTDDWDQIVNVGYPSRQAFLAMVSRPDYLAALYHRDAGLARTSILCCEAGLVI
jgi:uncharacterized protein (DUF1330 family)